ncbi:MAG: AAA family ATPase [Panacagrimonas sp.]
MKNIFDAEELEFDETESDIDDAPLSPAARYLAAGMADWLLSQGNAQCKRPYIEGHLPALLGQSDAAVRRLSLPRVRAALAQRRAACLTRFRRAQKKFARRLAPLALKLKLCAAAQSLLFFSYLARSEKKLKEMADAVPVKHRSDVAEALRTMLGGEAKQWRLLLGAGSPLRDSGLLNGMEFSVVSDLDDVACSVKDLTEAIDSELPLSTCLLENALRALDGSALDLDQFGHLRLDLDIVLGLVSAADSRTQILLGGAPGVGKTQFVRALAARLGRRLYEIKSEDEDGDAGGRDIRFQHYVLAQKLMTYPEHSLLLFDEAEDVFTGDHWSHIAPTTERRKGWTNRVLESAQVPTIWISNSIERIDPAYLRRFDHVVQMEVPPRSVRRGMLDQALVGHGVSAAFMDRVAESADLSPADIDRTARALGRLANSSVPKDELAGRILTARPNGVPRALVAARREQTRIPYRLEWINCDADMSKIIDGLRSRRQGTLGFFGPPGTGKTELAKHIARSLDRPLHLMRVSDLLDKYVGETEKNLARAFEQAAEEGAVLFLDEADSFLQDRARASRSWEITQVNELLAQLDGYNGVAILASNFVDNLDAALMRRLDVKATFGYLKPVAALALCRELLGNEVPASGAGDAPLHALVQLDLSFGDFAAAIRGLDLSHGRPDAEALSAALRQELRHRKGVSKAIGFFGADASNGSPR